MAGCLAHGASTPGSSYYRMSFTFTRAFPSYHLEWVSKLVSDNPQPYVRAYEVETVTTAGQHRYVVAIDINAAQHNQH